MDNRILLMQDDKEKLVDEILDLRRQVKSFREKAEALEKELAELKQKASPKADKPEFNKTVEKKRSLPPHRWGRKAGHPGCTRPKPEQIDRTVEQSLKTCPGCHHSLGQPTETTEHIQEEIIPARVEVTRFLHHRYWCCRCKKIFTAPYASEEVPHGYLGPRALATMVWLKYHLALPANKIQNLMLDLSGLMVSQGAITQALQRLADYLQIETAQILAAVRRAPYKHADETGWTINGVSHWLWSFVNTRWAFFHIDKSRGSKVPKAFLGHPFKGTLISDFFSAYNKLAGAKQKCLVHLKRDIRNARSPNLPAGRHGPPLDFTEPQKKLNRLLSDATRLAQRRRGFSPLVFARRARRIKQRLFDFACANYSNKFWQRISARLLKHHQEIFTFLDKPGLPQDNNAAERSIKPHVIVRNRSYQNRTLAGANAHATLSSLLQTLLLQKRSVVPSLAKAYVQHRQGVANPILFSSKG